MSLIKIKRICEKCFTDLEYISVCGVRILHCPKCTNPNKKRRGFNANISQKKLTEYKHRSEDKKIVKKLVWEGKQTEAIGYARKGRKKKRHLPKMFLIDGGLNDRRILAERKK